MTNGAVKLLQEIEQKIDSINDKDKLYFLLTQMEPYLGEDGKAKAREMKASIEANLSETDLKYVHQYEGQPGVVNLIVSSFLNSFENAGAYMDYKKQVDDENNERQEELDKEAAKEAAKEEELQRKQDKIKAYNEAEKYFKKRENRKKIRYAHQDDNGNKYNFRKIGSVIYLKTEIILGEGAYGKCKEYVDKNGNKFAIKTELRDKRSFFDVEKGILKKLNMFFGEAVHKYGKEGKEKRISTGENVVASQKLYTVMPKIEGSELYAQLEDMSLHDRDKLIVAIKLLEDIQNLHENVRGVHLDLHLGNVLVNKENDVVTSTTIDFGLSKKIPMGRKYAKGESIKAENDKQNRYPPEAREGNFYFSTDIYMLADILKGLNIDHEIIDRMKDPDPLKRPSAREVVDVLYVKLKDYIDDNPQDAIANEMLKKHQSKSSPLSDISKKLSNVFTKPKLPDQTDEAKPQSKKRKSTPKILTSLANKFRKESTSENTKVSANVRRRMTNQFQLTIEDSKAKRAEQNQKSDLPPTIPDKPSKEGLDKLEKLKEAVQSRKEKKKKL